VSNQSRRAERSEPESGAYRSTQIYKLGHDVPVVVDAIAAGQIAVADLLSPRDRRTKGGEA
jgi:hypothetical protein